MGTWKKSRKERVKEAKRIAKIAPSKPLETVVKEVKDTIEESLKAIRLTKYTIEVIDLLNNNYVKPKDAELFFVEFTRTGYIVVVGAGSDYGMPKNKKYLNAEIIAATEEEWSNQALLVSVKGLRKTKGRSGTGPENPQNQTSYFRCRNGVEMYLGECLAKKFPILNVQSHENYKPDFWQGIEESIDSVFK